MAEPSPETHHPAAIKIKTEKIDPEVEEKIKILSVKIKQEKKDNEALSRKGNDAARDTTKKTTKYVENPSPDEEEKKSVEPVKSSNEILAELFQVFNAAPPEELMDDNSLLKKHKKHKKEKKKKSKKSKSDDGNVEDLSEIDSVDSFGRKSTDSGRQKHKKKKKHKHKDDKDRDKAKEKDKNKEKSTKVKRNDPILKPLEGGNDKSAKTNTTTTSVTISVCSSGKKAERSSEHGSHESVTNNFFLGRVVKVKTEQPEPPMPRAQKEDDAISEISLSDEETYLKEREQLEQHTTNNRTGHERASDKRPRRNSFYDGSARSRSRDRDRDRERNYDRHSRLSRHPVARRRTSRSRSRSRSRDLGIDKKRLLEIARKNAISMFKRGNLPGCDNMTEEVKDKVLLKMRYGGRTVQDLTEFCKKISNGENLSDISSDEDSDCDKQGNPKAFHHPFQLKEREPIVMHIRNAKTLVPRPGPVNKTEEQAKAITMQFPVSSGQQHRISEASWVPVPQKEAAKQLPPLPPATQSTSIFKTPLAGNGVPASAPKNVFQKVLPTAEQQEPAFRSTVEAPTPPPVLPQMAPMVPPPTTALPAPITRSFGAAGIPPAILGPPPMVNISLPPPAVTPAVPAFVPDVPVPSTMPTPMESIFPQQMQNDFDVSSIISKRLYAMRKLQENPLDTEAMKLMRNSQTEITSWASSKHLPGQFTGSTGVQILKVEQLNAGPQVWARRDQLTNTKPVTGGMGMALLQKMGWKPGEGLGREKTGSLQPLLLDVKLDKRGLTAKEDNRAYAMPQPIKKPRPANRAEAMQLMQDKHPVCLLNEVTSKRKWTPPMYTLINEVGPSHNKAFQFSVAVNGQTFTPSQVSNTKKDAKLLAARFCLQQLGILT